jgi:P4 family phage/plasmid primase-like protien
MYDIPLIKSRINCIDYAQRINLPVRKDGDRCKSPLRTSSDNKSAFSVHADYWHDFVSCEGGDVIDLCALTMHNGDRGLAINDLARITGVTSDESDFVDWQQRTQRRVSLIQGWYEDLRPSDREYLHERRITDETIDRLRLGYTGQGTDVIVNGEHKYNFGAGRLSIPAYKNGYVVSWVARERNGQSPKYLKPPSDDITENEPWGLQTLDRKSDDLYIAEGAFDYLSLEQSGFPVLATMGGYFGRDALKTVISIAKNFKRVVLTFDNDDAGRKFTKDFGNILFGRKIKFAVAEIPNKYKDISDYYADGNELTALKMQDGEMFLALSLTDKEEFKMFAYKAARLMDKAELSDMFSAVIKSERFGLAWMKEVQASCKRPPLEIAVVSEILKAHKLLYVAAVGFYEYMSCGKWTLHNDEVIHGYIADALGVYAQGNKLDSVKKLMRSKVLTTQEFDKNPLVCFINGTLELETGIFRDHSPGDYCSVQMNYPYIPEAKCPLFEKFISEITAEDPKRQENLQFIAGYVLFNDCRHEKIFVFTGDGSNGKSVFTKTLERLYGSENITSIDPVGMTDNFERIHLRSSLVNIAGDIKSDLTSAEEKLKQISSGDSIQACFKGKDMVNFRARTKLIFCCNGQLKSSDTSDGLARRLVIIDFPCKFVDTPQKGDPYQKQKDVNLAPKLLTELSGIFNWAYQGYKDLLFFGSFTETDEHQGLMKAFRQASNPVEVFFEDFMDDPPKTISRKTLYFDYAKWCESNGHKALASTRFHPEFRKVAKGVYDEYDRRVKINGSSTPDRGYELVNCKQS